MSDGQNSQIERRGAAESLSPRQLATVIGVSESSVKRWVDAGEIEAGRTAGGHRRIALAEAVRFIRQGGHQLARPDHLGLGDLDFNSAARPPEDELKSALSAGAAPRAQGLLVDLYLKGRSVSRIVDGPVRESLSRLGELWLDDPAEGIFREHRATEISQQAITRLRALVDRVDSPVAVGCAPEGDPYRLPTLSAAAVLESIGFRAVNLGPETPTSALEFAIDRLRPRLVWLSVSVAPEAARQAADIERLRRNLAGDRVPLVVGGRSVEELELAPAEGLYIADTMAELEALAAGLVASGALAQGVETD